MMTLPDVPTVHVIGAIDTRGVRYLVDRLGYLLGRGTEAMQASAFVDRVAGRVRVRVTCCHEETTVIAEGSGNTTREAVDRCLAALIGQLHPARPAPSDDVGTRSGSPTGIGEREMMR